MANLVCFKLIFRYFASLQLFIYYRSYFQIFYFIDEGCIQKGVIIHELMHSVGFFHEQSRTDRDQYIEIRWENVESGMEYNFEKFSANEIDPLNTQYDYGSIMHYGQDAFSK